jgi:hypothetical protein
VHGDGQGYAVARIISKDGIDPVGKLRIVMRDHIKRSAGGQALIPVRGDQRSIFFSHPVSFDSFLKSQITSTIKYYPIEVRHAMAGDNDYL